MKFLYVLVSTGQDYYYEQLLMSVYSLKRLNPNSSISLLLDNLTYETLNGKRSEILKYVSEVKIEQFASGVDAVYKSRYLKTKMRLLVKGDFLFIDVDTVWCELIDESDFVSDVMSVPDAHCLQKDHPMKYFIRHSLNKCRFNPSFPYHMNSGVIFMKDTEVAKTFSLLWHQLWRESVQNGVVIDQPAFNQANYLSGNVMQILPSCYNAQILRCINELANAKIIHYFSSWGKDKNYKPAYKLLQKDVLNEVKHWGISDELKCLLDNPKQAFDKQTNIVNNDVSGLWSSSFGTLLSRLADSECISEKFLLKIITTLCLSLTCIFYKLVRSIVFFEHFSL